jgi:hypothetical protein
MANDTISAAARIYPQLVPAERRPTERWKWGIISGGGTPIPKGDRRLPDERRGFISPLGGQARKG